jgi:hypothetical protein
MANITADCTIEAPLQKNDRPFEWMFWSLIIPEASLGTSDVIDLPNEFQSNTRISDLRTSLLDAVTATTCTLAVHQAIKTHEGGAIVQGAAIVAGVDMEVTGTSAIPQGTTLVTVFNGFGDADDSINSRVLQLELTTNASTAGDMTLLLAALIGRVNY